MEHTEGNCKIKYRLPNFADTQIIFGEINIGNMDINSQDKNWEFILLGKVLGCMGFLIESIAVGDKEKSYDQVLNDPENASLLTPVASKIIETIMRYNSKKKSV